MNKKGTIILLTVTIIFIIGISLIYKTNEDLKGYDLKIYFFNAGKADAILISKNNKYIMIDTGEKSLSTDLLNYFRDNNITKLDYLIITHFDKDHVGSASSIIDYIEIGEILQSNVPKDSEYYTSYINSIENKNITPVTVTGDYDISFEDLIINVNGPTTIYSNNESNNSSLIVSIKYKENKFLFMGDSENARINDFVSSNSETYDFIKIPYHGNYLKKLSELLNNVNAKYGVITCSSTEGCEENALNVIKSYNIKYYMTKNGPITILSNGKKIIKK